MTDDWTHAHALNPELAGALAASSERVIEGRVVLHEPQVRVIPGLRCPAARRHYGSGQCALLALAILSERPSAQAVVVHPLAGIDEWVHALVALESGLLMDIDGLRQGHSLTMHWDEIAPGMAPFALRPLGQSDTERLLGRLDLADPVEREVAITFTRGLLAEHGL
jgi:hypothetical protein